MAVKTSTSWSLVLIIALSFCLLVLSFVRARLDVKRGVGITERYTKKRLVYLFIVIPLLCGIAAFSYMQFAPQHREFLPLIFFGILIIGKLAMWLPRQLVGVDQAGQGANPEQPALTKGDQAQQIRQSSITAVMLTLFVVILILVGCFAAIHNHPLWSLLLVSTSVFPASRIITLVEKLSK